MSIKPYCSPINNNNDNYVTIYLKIRKVSASKLFLETGGLIRNGEFEIPGVELGRIFADWEASLLPINVVRTT